MKTLTKVLVGVGVALVAGGVAAFLGKKHAEGDEYIETEIQAEGNDSDEEEAE